MPGSAARRWQDMVRERLEGSAILDRVGEGVDPAFWDDRAERFARQVAGTVARDPLLSRVLPHVDADTVVVDVGAGTGRFALALAAHARAVLAVDPSPQMLRLLGEDADARGITNVRTICGRAEDDTGAATGDVAVCAHVLPVIPDASRFLAQLDRLARRRVFVYMAAGSSDLRTDPLWRYFHGRPRPPAPTYLDAIAVLGELGIHPQTEIVEMPTADRWVTVADAVEDHVDALRLGDSTAVKAELSRLLHTWLVRREDGTLRAPMPVLPAAILSWTPTAS